MDRKRDGHLSRERARGGLGLYWRRPALHGRPLVRTVADYRNRRKRAGGRKSQWSQRHGSHRDYVQHFGFLIDDPRDPQGSKRSQGQDFRCDRAWKPFRFYPQDFAAEMVPRSHARCRSSRNGRLSGNIERHAGGNTGRRCFFSSGQSQRAGARLP